MSLLIPSVVDYSDAHNAPETEQEYKDEVAKLSIQEPSSFRWKFETVPGFFAQLEPDLDDLEFNYAERNLGRKKSWKDIVEGVAQLNKLAQPNECYKVVFCARHGQGFHNQIVEKYGLDEWNKKWNVLGTDGEFNYGPDAMLTPKGILQAKENREAWRVEVEEHGAPIPSKFYVSPLQRSLWTCVYTWEGIRPSSTKVKVVEKLRETIGRNLCDQRSTKTVITERFGKHDFVFEDGFTETDQLHTPKRETDLEQAVRLNRFCQEMFEEDWNGERVDVDSANKNALVSTTSHAGTIRLLIIVFGHRRFTISTGGMIPIVVKATRTT